MMTVRVVAIWLIILFAESVHGVLRGLSLVPIVGDFRARQLSVFSGSLMILAIGYGASPWLAAQGIRQNLFIGLCWLTLTLAFEIGLGRFASACIGSGSLQTTPSLKSALLGWECSSYFWPPRPVRP